jgi:hypothetical protein
VSNVPGPNPVEPTFKPRSAREIAAETAFIQKAAQGLLALHKKDGKQPSDNDEDMIALSVIADMDVMPAKAAAIGALTGLVPGDALYLMWQRARNALQLLGTVAMMRLADKMDNSRAPGDTRVLLKIVEWAGLPTPSEAPVTDSDRLDQMTQTDARKLSEDDLNQRLAAALKKGN